MRRALLCVLTVNVLARVTGSDAAVLCVTAKRAIVVREECKKKELRLALDQFGAVGQKGDKGDRGDVGPPGSKGDPGPPGGGPAIIDANGTIVGWIIGAGSGAQIVRKVGDRFLVFSVDEAGFIVNF